MKTHGVMQCMEADARIAELEAQLAVANATIADLRDYNERVPKLAAEVADKQKAELEARLREAEARAETALREKAEAIRLAALARNEADELRGNVTAWVEAALRHYPPGWAFDTANPELIIANIAEFRAAFGSGNRQSALQPPQEGEEK